MSCIASHYQEFKKLCISATSFSITTMSCVTDNNSKPKSMSRAKGWTAEVENLFRFQQAGYRDELEYIQVKQGALVNILICSCVFDSEIGSLSSHFSSSDSFPLGIFGNGRLVLVTGCMQHRNKRLIYVANVIVRHNELITDVFM